MLEKLKAFKSEFLKSKSNRKKVVGSITITIIYMTIAHSLLWIFSVGVLFIFIEDTNFLEDNYNA